MTKCFGCNEIIPKKYQNDIKTINGQDYCIVCGEQLEESYKQDNIRLNKSGYPIKECLECKQDINVNSFSDKDNNLCSICYEDINDVKVFEVIEGDYNDVFSKKIVRATNKLMDQYCKEQFDPKDDAIEDLGSDSIGYCVYYDHGEGDIEYYIEAREIEDYRASAWGNIDFDLTNEDD